jgi:geranylgeranyl pyrophosphate synthase/predicted secreted hydrolase
MICICLHVIMAASIQGAPASLQMGKETVYDEESGVYEIKTVAITDHKHAATGEDTTLFRVESTRFKVGTQTPPSNESEGGPSARQSVWRSYADFRALHAAMQLETNKSIAAPFPEQSSWFRQLVTNWTDHMELRRALLENYLKALLSQPIANKSKTLLNFLKPSEREDWPSAVGAIDLDMHDLPHESSQTEWWYYNTHFQDADGNDYSAFAAFFRVVKHTDKDTGKKSYAHALNWAITDVTNKKYVQEVVLDKDSPAIVKKQLDQGIIKDARLEAAYREMLDRGNVPLPDRMFSKGRDAICHRDKLFVDLESAVITKNKDGHYVLTCTTPNGQTGVELVFEPLKAPVRHGLDGIVKGHDGDDMFYYCISRCNVTGYFTMNGVRKPIASGQGWYDHEFGGKAPENDVPTMNYAWNWAAIQLSNNYEISVAVLIDPRSKPWRLMESRAVVVDPSGRRTQPTDLMFKDLNSWTSVRSFTSYPTQWQVSLPSAGIELHLDAPFDDQEFMTLISNPGFWEGRVNVSGTMNGRSVTGVGYVERNGFQPLTELDSFFKAVGAETRRAVRTVYPDVVTPEHAVTLIGTQATPWYTDGVDLEAFYEGIIAPVRYICDQGGKSWRSYGMLACMDVVGGDSRKYLRWLSMPEFMHVGSLIIDDIQDRSEKRRGAPCAHIKYGEPVAINAGTAAYFQGQQLWLIPGLSAEHLNQIYNYYFGALRAGHAGQALDIAGLTHIMDDVIERQDYDLAESRVLAIHRLKTAVPAASLARMGALVGGGTDVQIEAIGRYYESIGLAFQIMDDVLNLRGLYSGKADSALGVELKVVGEDIMAGKVTFPVVKAISRVSKEQMRKMWEVIKRKPQDHAVVADIIQQLEDCHAIDACEEHSRTLVEDAYKKLDAVIPDSFSKIMLRAFGWFVTERKR